MKKKREKKDFDGKREKFLILCIQKVTNKLQHLYSLVFFLKQKNLTWEQLEWEKWKTFFSHKMCFLSLLLLSRDHRHARLTRREEDEDFWMIREEDGTRREKRKSLQFTVTSKPELATIFYFFKSLNQREGRTRKRRMKYCKRREGEREGKEKINSSYFW